MATLSILLPLQPARAEAPAAPQGAVVPSPRGDGSTMTPMRRTTHAERSAAALRALERRKANEAAGRWRPKKRHVAPEASNGGAGVRGAAAGLLRMALAQLAAPDLYGSPNYANSKLPVATCSDHAAVTCVKDADCPGYEPPYLIGPDLWASAETCTGPVVSGGIRKFVDTLPGLCPLGKNNLGNCLPVATPDTTTFPGSDYYEIGLEDFVHQFHSDLAHKTKVRGYYQKNAAPGAEEGKTHYLGPFIVATSNRPVRLKFVNQVGTGAAGDLFIPMDSTLAGTGTGPDGQPYTQNRATIHLHGGNTPWISDGTQHQWTVPAGESTTHKKGASVEYVPDMWFDSSGNPIPVCAGLVACGISGATNDPGDGALTFYYTNQQSGRLIFYHDHAYGITRLNVYVGEAAGYLLVNPPDEDALRVATVPGTLGSDPASWDLAHMIPFVIQDRTFVPPAAQLADEDPTWDPARWGGEDALWFPHVYTPNQWPENPDLSSTNPYGRWDYGPWFWPPQQSLTSLDGEPRPLTVPCTSTAAVSETNPTGTTVCPSTPTLSLVPESFLDTPVVNGQAYPTMQVEPAAYRFQMLNASQERNYNLSFFVADASGTEVAMVEAVPHTAHSSMPLCAAGAPRSGVTGTPNGPDLATPTCWPREWPTDGRQGGVPHPADVGPQWVQIGSEGGILPAPAVIPPTPQGYEYNRRNIVVLNVANKALFIGPAERADVVVDFSAYAGKTLILYNDAPAPVPAGDPRQDYYTGGPDLTTSGGAPTPLPGYGPNTRTVMQIKVKASRTAPQPALDLAAMTTAMNQRFAASQPAPIVPQAAYTPVYSPATPYGDTFVGINAQNVTFTPVGASSPVTMPFGWKALHELFDVDYGRMNSLIGVEIPLTSWLNQTTIPFSNIDPATDFLTDQQPQIWKITHNGVDTHTIHFHLVNVQILNRVGWDGQIRGPDANELGWKESVRMHPLEDIYVALKPVRQTLPWPIPDKWRPLDVDRPLGSATQFTAVDVNNNPIPVVNQMVNYGWEYVWHCHLLGHEEGDMLRAEVFVVAPEAPSALVAARYESPTRRALLRWQDNSKSALSFNVQRDTSPDFSNPSNLTAPAPTKQPGVVSFADTSIAAGTTYYYRVQATKTLTSLALPDQTFPASSGWTAGVQAAAAPLAKLSGTEIAVGDVLAGSTSAVRSVTLTNQGSAALAISGVSLSGANAAEYTLVNGCGADVAISASCTIGVTLTPATAGLRSATLTIATDDPFAPSQTVAVTGHGVAPVAGVNKTSLVYAGQALDTTSAAQLVTLSNTGNAPLLVSSVAVTGANAAEFPMTKTCGTSLGVNGTCTISVSFRPTASGLRTATLAIASNDPARPTLSAALDGNKPASAVALTASLPSPQPAGTAVTFTAAGAGSSGYDYRFWLDGGTGPVVVQDYGHGATWQMPGTTPLGTYRVIVHVRTSPNVSFDARAEVAYTIRSAAATGVTLVASKPSPQVAGTVVVFTAAGQGSSGYQYRFWLDSGSGPVMVQDYGPTTQWTMSAPAVGSYRVIVHVRTSPSVSFDARAEIPYVIRVAPATGVTLSADRASPQLVGTTVIFTAAGSGSSGYDYRFWLDDGTGPRVVQDYGHGPTYTTASTLPAAKYRVIVHVRTSPAAAFDARAEVSYTLRLPPATAVSLAADRASPQPAGTPVVFTAAGQGSSGYEYRFWLDDGTGPRMLQDYGVGPCFTMLADAAPGTYRVIAHVRTSAAVSYDARAEIPYVLSSVVAQAP
jgi:FtsP/CotA-like multicopper oxidase with cupredoxin domain